MTLRHWAAALLIACVIGVGCGKKGPPLTPFLRVPVAVAALAPKRVGDDVYVTFTVPAQNLDASAPASIARVEIYGATALTPPSRTRILEIATLVGSIPVAPAADPATPGLVPPPDPKAGALQGAVVTVRDRLTPESRAPRELPLLEEERQLRQNQDTGAVVATPQALRRFYIAIPYSNRGQSGPPSAVVEMLLTPLPDAPTDLQVTTTAAAAIAQWQPSGGLVGWLTNQATPIEPSPVVDPLLTRASVAPVTADLPPGPTLYNIYRELAPDPLVQPDARTAVMPWTAPAPAPVNPAPVATLTFSDPITPDERERCYTVRAVRGPVESLPSTRECLTPYDTYPPAAPTQLGTIAGEGFINLFWAPNDEPDLGGYIVLRVAAGGDTLLQLTATPIPDTRYTDRTVTPGVRYTYVVRAVDTRIPVPNMSEPAEVSDTAR